jgi:formylglycine-generating enzyme required for sulfatase activity
LGHLGKKMSRSYLALRRLVRMPGIESNMTMLNPLDFHADSSPLVHMLRKGHHGVKLSTEAWARIITWIDLNAPYFGKWSDIGGEHVIEKEKRRTELRCMYAGIDVNHEELIDAQVQSNCTAETVLNVPEKYEPVQLAGWPFNEAAARNRQQTVLNTPFEHDVDLGNGIQLQLVRIPAGDFVMGDANGTSDEGPPSVVTIDSGFWIGTCEISNEQYRRFNPFHDSDYESRNSYQFGVRGFPRNRRTQPVVHVSWHDAVRFCRQLSQYTGGEFRLPTEAEWEYACRAGTDTMFAYGGQNADFSEHANIADVALAKYYANWVPHDPSTNDNGVITMPVGSYEANAWGLHDTHGNVWEWTQSMYSSYPYRHDDGRNASSAEGYRVVRGGSWRDKPFQCRSASRGFYRPWHTVYNVGFRVVCSRLPDTTRKDI